MNKPYKNVDSFGLNDLVLWEDIALMTNNEDIVKKINQIPKETYLFAIKKSNRKFLVESAFKSLQKTDPKATIKEAELLADTLCTFAKIFINDIKVMKKNKKVVQMLKKS
jgi:hypothetical protein